LEFKKKHECEIYLSTFHNSFFTKNKNYKDIKFINPGESVPCDALYRLGWFKKDNKWNDTDRNPNQVNIIPLQKTASDILGLKFEEINYGVHFVPKKNPKDKKYIVIVPNATAGCKEWIYSHWVELTKMIREKGYDVVSLTKYPHFIDGVENIFDEDLETVMNYMYHAEKFIGLGSGLSWLNWAMGKHTHMINGFARDGHEFTSNVTRIYNHDTCVFCWNDEVFVFDAGDWDWCPVYKNTSKQHICQKSILPSQVFEKLGL
jgi:autotransporter strand-loop-strand O-heptosyltransferase